MTPSTRQHDRLSAGIAFVAIATIVFTLIAPTMAQTQGPRMQGPIQTRPAETVASRTPVDPDAAMRPVQTLLEEGIPAVVAEINGNPISRDELAQDCLQLHGQAILERLINKFLILNECSRVGITITEEDVNDEIAKTAAKFNLPVKEYLEMLESERGIDPIQYKSEIVWPTLALRRLAVAELVVSEDEIRIEFERRYGPAVQTRMIACRDLEHAQDVMLRLTEDAESFPTIAKNESMDRATAPYEGLMYPIRMHAGPIEIENAVFSLEEGQISSAVLSGGQYYIFKCENRFPHQDVMLTPDLKTYLSDDISDLKLRDTSDEIFQRLQSTATVENIMNNPARIRELPGVAALVNGRAISTLQLAEVCMERHGEEVLDELLHRVLLSNACHERDIVVTQNDLDAEITRAAMFMLPPKDDGSPDIQGWIDMVTAQEGITLDVYRQTIVLPTVQLKRLAGESIEVTDEELQFAFDANYAPRARCLAIVLNNHNRALEVFAAARDIPTQENFADLAREYCLDPSIAGRGGEIPPIQRNGNQPRIEDAAFALQAGEMSGIIQVAVDRFILIYSLGFTEQRVFTMDDEVRSLLNDDIYEKKLRIKMANYLEGLLLSSVMNNYLTGESYAPAPTVPDLQSPALSDAS